LCKLAFLKFLEGYLNNTLEHKNLVESQKENRYGISRLTIPSVCSKYENRTTSHSPQKMVVKVLQRKIYSRFKKTKAMVEIWT